MFAVVKTGGLQYRVTEDETVRIGRIAGEPGDIVQLGNVLMLGGATPQIGKPAIAGASIAVEILQQSRGRKIIAFKKRRRKNSRRKRGFRPEYTIVRISEILTDGKAPTKKARAKPAPKPKAEGAEGEKPAAKSAAKSTAKSASKPKTAAKKPAAKAKAKAEE